MQQKHSVLADSTAVSSTLQHTRPTYVHSSPPTARCRSRLNFYGKMSLNLDRMVRSEQFLPLFDVVFISGMYIFPNMEKLVCQTALISSLFMLELFSLIEISCEGIHCYLRFYLLITL